MKQKIELQKTRDFGEIISDTFNFIFQNFKPLMACFFTFTGLLLVGNVVTQSLQQTQMINTANSISSASTQEAAERLTPFSFINWEYMALSVVFIIVTYTVIGILVYGYMALYKEKGNVAPKLDEVWGYIKYYFMRVVGAQVLLAVLLIVGMIFCLVPGLWLFPIFALILPIIVIENAGFGFAFNKAFNIIKDNWWVTFGTLVVISIIASMLTAIVTMPAQIFNAVSIMFYQKQSGFKISAVTIVITSALQQLCLVFTIILYVAAGLCYYNLTETKEGTGILGRIENFGNNAPDANLPAEEY